MRIIGITELETGDVLAKSVLGNNGIVMLEAGTVLTEKYIHRLRTLKIKTVYLSDASETFVADNVRASRHSLQESWMRSDIEEMKNNEEARKEAVKLVAEFADEERILERVALPFPESQFRQQFREMLLDIVSQPALADELSVIMQTDRILFEHALNVTLCSSVMGIAQRLDRSQQQELAVGALFCDIGMTRLPMDFTKVNRELKDSELAILRQHTSEGYRVLKGMKDIPLVSAQCALLHHERYLGTGYPLGMTVEHIPEFAQIVGIADVYNALGSPRHHRNAYRPGEAVEFLFASGNYNFDWELVKKFLNHVVIYPVSMRVKLSDGRIAQVVETAGRPIQRPVVQIVGEANGKAVESRYTLDLQQHPNVVIVGKADR
ncbi:HD domain-containing protein [Cohnella endophytica]|uniref:HD domain-containing protein n=1 Tax=Cohnella endophytica TaxID=2419778 RepID=A0A494X9A5_9BACL|nr:HD domain-containing phosphohydrolase [Cohnella endophytica]RKP47285.1 HD domain-containing protein [Cohnella endophytica]